MTLFKWIKNFRATWGNELNDKLLSWNEKRKQKLNVAHLLSYIVNLIDSLVCFSKNWCGKIFQTKNFNPIPWYLSYIRVYISRTTCKSSKWRKKPRHDTNILAPVNFFSPFFYFFLVIHAKVISLLFVVLRIVSQIYFTDQMQKPRENKQLYK